MKKKFLILVFMACSFSLSACYTDENNDEPDLRLEGDWFQYRLRENIVLTPLDNFSPIEQKADSSHLTLLSKFKIKHEKQANGQTLFYIHVLTDQAYLDPDYTEYSLTVWIAAEVKYFINGMYLGIFKSTNESNTWNYIAVNQTEPSYQHIFKIIDLANNNAQLSQHGTDFNNLNLLGQHRFKHPDARCIQFHAKKYKQGDRIHSMVFPFKHDQNADSTRCDLYNLYAIQELKTAFPHYNFIDPTETRVKTSLATKPTQASSEVVVQANQETIVP